MVLSITSDEVLRLPDTSGGVWSLPNPRSFPGASPVTSATIDDKYWIWRCASRTPRFLGPIAPERKSLTSESATARRRAGRGAASHGERLVDACWGRLAPVCPRIGYDGRRGRRRHGSAMAI